MTNEKTLGEILAAMDKAIRSKAYAEAVDRALRENRRAGGDLMRFRASLGRKEVSHGQS